MTASNLELLNAFRAADGLDPYKDWRKARHQSQLDAYMAAQTAETPVDAHDPDGDDLDTVADTLTGGDDTTEQVNGKDTNFVEAMKSNDFANKEVGDAAAAEKRPTYKEMANYEKSTIDKPVGFIHQFLTEHPTLTRKQAVGALMDYGVNYSTARTQYQRWFSKRKQGE